MADIYPVRSCDTSDLPFLPLFIRENAFGLMIAAAIMLQALPLIAVIAGIASVSDSEQAAKDMLNPALLQFFLFSLIPHLFLFLWAARGVRRKKRLLAAGQYHRALIYRGLVSWFPVGLAKFGQPKMMKYVFSHEGKKYTGILRRDIRTRELPLLLQQRGATVRILFDPQNPFNNYWAQPLEKVWAAAMTDAGGRGNG